MALYKDQSPSHRCLKDILQSADDLSQSIFVLHWGPDVTQLAKELCEKQARVVYFDHSTGWEVKLPKCVVPVDYVSRHTQAYWGRVAPNNPIFLCAQYR